MTRRRGSFLHIPVPPPSPDVYLRGRDESFSFNLPFAIQWAALLYFNQGPICFHPGNSAAPFSGLLHAPHGHHPPDRLYRGETWVGVVCPP